MFTALEGRLTCWLVNAAHLRNVPGRKTDVADSVWIARIMECGLVRPSFVPVQEFRELRDPTRARTAAAQERVAVHQAVRRFAHAAAASGPVLDADRLSYLRCVRIARRSVPSQHDTSRRSLTNAWKEAGQEARSRPLPPRSGRGWPRAIKKPMRWPILRTRSGRSKVEPGRWAHNQTTKQRKHRGVGRPVPRAQPS
ncbi:IS110 family transposase [Streptomyces sp. NPDC002545]